MAIERIIDVRNLVRELAENKVDSLELVREALSNAKDHGAKRFWMRAFREEPRSRPSVIIADDGEGMTDERLAAFWGVGATRKNGGAIGYKGHGTKLFFASKRLSVATRANGDADWRLTEVTDPGEFAGREVGVAALPAEHRLGQLVAALGLQDKTGSVVWIDELSFSDAEHVLQRRRVESFIDWFTVVGDVRSGLYDGRHQFHEAVKTGVGLDALRVQEIELRPIDVYLRVNGEKEFTPMGLGPAPQDKDFYRPWTKDFTANSGTPGILSLGHRFADKHESEAGAKRVRDDLTALRLTSPATWATDDGLSIVLRVEGHRRQRETYTEAQWQNHKGVYGFEERFGLWLCRDFIPVARRNDLLHEALDRASKSKLRFELGSLRNWQVFVNSQGLLPTANRDGVSNAGEYTPRIVEVLAGVIEQALKDEAFREWVQRLRSAVFVGQRDREIAHMEERRTEMKAWIDKGSPGALDPLKVQALEPLTEEYSLQMRPPTSEQELFYLYGLLSARFRMPLHVLEYDAAQGVDAIALVNDQKLFPRPLSHARVEFKYVVSANTPLDHFFEAIDVVVCWSVDRLGPVYEESSLSDTLGDLRRRDPVSASKLDRYEIVYETGTGPRVIPVVAISALFAPPEKPKRQPRKRAAM